MSAPEPVAVRVWGEGVAERSLPRALRVLVGGQHAGSVARVEGVWFAHWHTAAYGLGRRSSDRSTGHPGAEAAVRAVIRSGWARHLGARAASRVHWTERARRLAGPATSGEAGQ